MHFDFSKADQLDFHIRTLDYRLSQLQLQSDDVVIAKTHSGRIRGAKRRTLYNRTYYSFERIPYAQPPVGELRFRAPRPVAPWRKIRDCRNYAAKPMQRSFVNAACVEGAEDCLYLNVYTNSVRPTSPRPVMVWIYGGGFACGEATREWYAPDYFMQQDIVLVTVQYRVGALGFLSLQQPHLHVAGNAGLKDQILALRWIRRNCERFGGDAERITVFGQNSGANCTLLLMLSKQASGLFQRAIAQSPVVSREGWVMLSSAQQVYKLAKAAGYVGENNESQILDYLLSCTAAQIVKAEAECITPQERLLNRFSLFGPCIEPYHTPHTVLAKAPMEMLAHAWGNAIPLIVGGNSNEGLFLLPIAQQHPEIVSDLLHTCMCFVPHKAVVDRDSAECRAKGLKLRQLHVQTELATIEDFCELASYAHHWQPIAQLIRARLLHARQAATYLYRFDYASTQLIHPFRLARCGCTAAPVQGGEGGAAAHGDELAYLFRNVLTARMEQQSLEYRTIKRLIGLWTTFTATGSPNGGRINGMKGTKWHSLRQDNSRRWQCLNIGAELKLIELPELVKLRSWQAALYSTQRELPQCASELVDMPLYVKSVL